MKHIERYVTDISNTNLKGLIQSARHSRVWV